MVLLLIQISSCKMFAIPLKNTFLPFTNFKVPPGTLAFQSGYKDGCSSVLYARGNVFYRSRYDYRYDPKMIGNAEYKSGYSRGWGWCFAHIIGLSSDAPLGSPDMAFSPYGPQPMFDMSQRGVDDAWGGFFGGKLHAPIDTTGTSLDSSYDILQKGVGGGDAVFTADPLWSRGKSGIGFMGLW